jgi:hypothetical protein
LIDGAPRGAGGQRDKAVLVLFARFPASSRAQRNTGWDVKGAVGIIL